MRTETSGWPAVLMLDVDGVVVVPRPGGWAANLETDLGLSRETLQARFFAPHWRDVVLGRAGLTARLAPVLAEIAPHLTPDALTRYWFTHDADLDHGLLADVARVRASGLPVHLATVQEHERAAYLWTTLGLREHFDGLHYAADLGAAKPEPAFYAAVERRMDRPARDLALIDDRAENVDAARAAGWRAALWDGSQPLAAVLAALA